MGNELYNSLLRDVSQEIDASLRDASFSIESFLHDQADEHDLINCLSFLNQVTGALEIMGNNGGLLLAQELESLARNLKEGHIDNPLDAIELLTRGIMDLPRYINLVIDGEHDHPAIFLPLVNEMRVLQKKKYLPEASVVKSESVDLEQVDLHLDDNDVQLLKQTRGKLLKAIVEWLKGNFSSKVVLHLYTHLQEAAENIHNKHIQQNLGLLAAVMQAIHDKKIDVGNEEHHTIASIDKYIQAALTGNEQQAVSIQQRLRYNYAALMPEKEPQVSLDKPAIDNLLNLQVDVARVRDKIHKSEGEERDIVSRLISDELQDLEGHVESILHNHVYENWNNVVLIAQNIRNSAMVAFDADVVEYINQLVDELDEIHLNEENIEVNLERAATIITTMGMVVDQNIFSKNHYIDPGKGSISGKLLQRLADKIHDELNDVSDLVLAGGNEALQNRREDIVLHLDEIAGAYDFINEGIARQIHSVVSGLRNAEQSVLNDSIVLSNFVSFLVALEEYGKYLDERSSHVDAESIFGSLVDELNSQISSQQNAELNFDDLNIELDIPGAEADELEVETQTGEQEEADELIEIFIEEANELLQTIQTSIDTLAQDIGDQDSLADMRRAFHSLKGSGRVAGATSIAEIAWDVEQDLNKIIEGSSSASEKTLTKCQIASVTIQQLLVVYHEGHAEVPELVDDYKEQCREDELDGSQEVTQTALDPVLHEIYSNETTGHLKTISEYVASCGASSQCYVAESLVRALHTISGSSEMAQVKDVARISSALEKYANHLDKNEQAAPVAFLQLLSDFVVTIKAYLPMLQQENAHLEKRDEMLSRVESLYEIIPSTEPSHDEDDSDRELFSIFVEEAKEILERLDEQLSVLGNNFSDIAIIQRLQRELHTLKGSSRMATVFAVADLAHATENVFNAIASNRHEMDQNTYHSLLKVQSTLMTMISELEHGQAASDAPELITELESLIIGSDISAATIVSAEDSEDDGDLSDFMNMSLEPLISDDAQVEADSVPVAVSADGDLDAMLDMDIALGDEQPLETKPAEWDGEIEDDETVISRLLMDSSILDLDDSLDNTVINKEDVALSISDDAVVATQGNKREAQDSDLHQGSIERATQVRVRSELLDDLLKSSGQITIYNTNLEQKIDSFKSNVGDFIHTVEKLKEQIKQLEIETESQIRSGTQSGLLDGDVDFDPLEFDRYSQLQTISRGLVESLNDLENIETDLTSKLIESENIINLQNRINTELHEGIMRSRMVPFASVMTRLNRVVSQAALELKKEVQFRGINADKEIDNNLLQSIIAPIEHILRNAVAHGIESADLRAQQGKDAKGDIVLALNDVGTELVIRISDDGAGLDLPRIRDKAIELGLIEDDRQYSDDFIAQLILESGLSTAAELSQISGRGVGMDVVANDIKHHGGVLHIATEKGKGTTFTIHLPQKLSLTQALLLRDGSHVYAIPVTGVEGFEYMSLGDEMPEDIVWRGERYQFIRLGELLNNQNERQSDLQSTPVVFFFLNEQRYALISDEFFGNREIIIKPLGPQLETVPFLNGGAILGTGEIALIINLPRLLRLRENQALNVPVVSATTAAKTDEVKVLVVDDSLTVRKVTSNFLKRHDYSVITARDGVEAIAVLEDTTPDIILLDIEMPRMNGYEFLQYIRADSRTHELPVIMITSRTGEKHRQKAVDMGVNAYMGKPYQEDQLLDEIQSLIRH